MSLQIRNNISLLAPFCLLPVRERHIFLPMRILSRKKLKEFWERHPDARQPLEAWYADARHAMWETPVDIKDVYRNASFVAYNRVVFNIKGNSYRLVVAVQFAYSIVFIRFIGTHNEYDRIDAATI